MDTQFFLMGGECVEEGLKFGGDVGVGIDGGGDAGFEMLAELRAEAMKGGAKGVFVEAGFGGEQGEGSVGSIAIKEGAEFFEGGDFGGGVPFVLE